MKKTNKFVTLLLAVVMVFAMSVSAFAAPANGVTFDIQAYGETILGEAPDVIGANMSVKDAIDACAPILGDPVWIEVGNLNPTYGSTAYVLKEVMGITCMPVGADSGISAQFWSAAYPGYGIESVDGVGENAVYHYIYVGDDWGFTVNGAKPVDPVTGYEIYMDQYQIQPNDVVIIDYHQVVERWDVPASEHWLHD